VEMGAGALFMREGRWNAQIRGKLQQNQWVSGLSQRSSSGDSRVDAFVADRRQDGPQRAASLQAVCPEAVRHEIANIAQEFVQRRFAKKCGPHEVDKGLCRDLAGGGSIPSGEAAEDGSAAHKRHGSLSSRVVPSARARLLRLHWRCGRVEKRRAVGN